jgi:hypothetical protein
MIGSGDGRPASQLQDAVNQSCHELEKRVAEWKELASGAASASTPNAFTTANVYLRDHNLALIPALGEAPTAPACK